MTNAKCLLSAAALASFATMAQAECPTRSITLATEARDITSTQRIYDDILLNTSCSDTQRAELRVLLSDLHQTASDRTTGAARIGHLEEALKYGRSWPFEAALGEALLAEKDYTRAATHLQQAINRLNDNPNEGEISQDAAMRLLRLASTAVGLAEGNVDIPITRSGNVGGILAPSIRGFEVKEVDLHVTFEFDSEEFTPDGIRMAVKLAESLIAEGLTSVVLEGHTDPRGTDAYNLTLSERRAKALQDFLQGQGFSGTVSTVAKGESEPPIVEAGLDLTEEEIFQLARRVELIR